MDKEKNECEKCNSHKHINENGEMTYYGLTEKEIDALGINIAAEHYDPNSFIGSKVCEVLKKKFISFGFTWESICCTEFYFFKAGKQYYVDAADIVLANSKADVMKKAIRIY